jgi:GGDEF domain-containing protein
MVRPTSQRFLLIGDTDHSLHTAVTSAFPGAAVRHAASIFDGIAELTADRFGAVLAAVEPVGRRPEAAVRTLRELAGTGRLVLFGHPSLEPLSRRMLQCGCDDYLVTPVAPAQIQQVLAGRDDGDTPLRLHTDYDGPHQTRPPQVKFEPMAEASTSLPVETPAPTVAEIVLEALLEHPGDAMTFAVNQVNAQLAGAMQLSYLPPGTVAPGRDTIFMALTTAAGPVGTLVLSTPPAQETAGRALLAEIGSLLAKTAAIQHRQGRLQKLAFTDDLTGLFNCRYFKHFLTRTLAEARKSRFPVTLFLFDIDDFKSYNDRFGHGVGDDILRQTANLMRRCVRDHDLVARIGGDEFAVVFWEKEGPRTPREAGPGVPGRPPSEPEQILARFRRLLATESFPLLGPTGRGMLTISGGLAVYPYDAQEVQSLIDAADKALMFGAKRSGRNSIHLVGGSGQGDSMQP